MSLKSESGSDIDGSDPVTPVHEDTVKVARRRKFTSSSSAGWGLPEPVVRVGDRTVFTHGRPPWYNCEGQAHQPFVIGICGGSASGKTSVARAIIESLDVQWVSLLSMDSYYRVLTPDQKAQAEACNYNFDHPNAFDFDLLEQHLSRLRRSKTIEVPEYDFKTHSRTTKTTTIYGSDVIIIEGILTFCSPLVTKLLDLKVFVDTDADERLARRLRRDIAERGRDMNEVLEQYTRFVKPSYEQFIAPTMAQADIIIPRGGKNTVALHLIIQHINKRLKQHGEKLRHTLVKLGNGNWFRDCSPGPDGDCANGTIVNSDRQKNGNRKDKLFDSLQPINLPPRVHVLPSTPQTLGLHALIRDHKTTQDDFVFYSERLMRPLCEAAMDLLPHMDVVIETPQNVIYQGRRLATGTQVCGVSILRAGEALEPALCAVCKDVRLGKILIQTNPVTCEPELHYIRLPRDIKDCFVILMDSTVASGAAAIMAMRILVEHDVPEDHIILVSLIMAIQGVYSVAYTYPKAHIITTAVDEGLTENYHIIPGIGNFGDRYFGTTGYSGVWESQE